MLVFSQFLVGSIKIIKVYTDTLFYILHQSRIRVPDQIQVLVFGMYFSYFKCLANRNNIATWQRCNLLNVRKHIRAMKNVQSRENGHIVYTRGRKTKQNHNTICVGHHYSEPNTRRRKTQHNTTQRKVVEHCVYCWGKSNTMGVTIGAGTSYPSGAPEFSPGF